MVFAKIMRTQLPPSRLTAKSRLRADKEHRGSCPKEISLCVNAAVNGTKAALRAIQSFCSVKSISSMNM